MTSCVSVSLDIGILHCVGAASLPPPPQPHLGHVAGGAESRGARRAPGTVTVPLGSGPNASPFWIMLLLVLGKLDNAMIRVRQPNIDVAENETGASDNRARTGRDAAAV